jgi:hypothetical protein
MLPRSERDALIEKYASGPALIRQVWERVPLEARSWRPSPQRWSAHEVVCHCADSETYAAIRIRLLFGERTATIIGYDQDAWCQKLDYAKQDAELALQTIAAVRAWTAPMLRSAPEDYWHHVGTHSEVGRYSANDWLRIYSDHLDVHARQIERNIEAFEGR